MVDDVSEKAGRRFRHELEHNGGFTAGEIAMLLETFDRAFGEGVAEGIRQAREGMDEEFQEPLTYRHPHTGATITSKRFRRYVTDWEEVS